MGLTINFNHYKSKALQQIEQTLHTLISRDVFSDASLFDAAHYALKGGKRLRPLLMLSVTEAFQIPMHKTLYPACALELIHCYSLIHDDLPCMDNDDFRRGKPSLHKAFPESLAILTGDCFLTYAFEILCSAKNLSSIEKLSLIRILSKHAGCKGMIGGQIKDIEAKNTPMDIYAFFQMQLQKTGSLMMASLEFAAILADQDPIPYKNIGEKLGTAYQIFDDLLDVSKEKNNAISLLGETQAREYLEKLSKEIFAEISHLDAPLIIFEELIRVVLSEKLQE